MADVDEASLLTVHLRGLPVELHEQAREYVEGLERELALVSAGDHDQELPSRLVSTLSELRERYAEFAESARATVERARDEGSSTIDVVLSVPPHAADAAAELGRLLDEADEYCREGQLLTLAAPRELRAYRVWYLRQVVDQAAGRPPVPWSPDAGWEDEPVTR